MLYIDFLYGQNDISNKRDIDTTSVIPEHFCSFETAINSFSVNECINRFYEKGECFMYLHKLKALQEGQIERCAFNESTLESNFQQDSEVTNAYQKV